MARQSEDLLARRLEELRRCFPEAFVEGRVDFERLRAALGEVVDNGPERYTFTWAGKRDALRLLQMPTRATLLPCPEESIDWDTTHNVFIEGENLEVLKLLLRPYYGRVKMIYIDPPYNTGNDFIYRDDYRDPLGAYLQMTGQRDEAGNLLTSNPETSGRYHSAWLSMMYPRLFLARQLLREDGVIFVSIDDHEVYNLRMIMNEVFGEENFVATIIWEKVHTRKNSALYFSVSHDYIACYAKRKKQVHSDSGWARNLLPREDDSAYSNPDNDPRGPWKPDPVYANKPYAADYTIVKPDGTILRPPEGQYWRFSETTWREFVLNGQVIWGSGDSYPMIKRYLSEVQEGLVPVTLFEREFAGDNSLANDELDTLLNVHRAIDYPKPSLLLRRLLQISTSATSPDIVMDFFAGSCTLAHAVLAQNAEDGGRRRFVVVQLPEPTHENSSARAAGFKTIAELGKERIRRVIARLKEQNQGQLDFSDRETPMDLGFRVYKLAPSNYRSWSGVKTEGDEPPSPEAYVEQMEMLIDTLAEGWTPEGVIAEVALKQAGFGLNYGVETIELQEQTVYRVTDPDREQAFYLCLDDTVRLEALKPLGLGRDMLFVCRASALDDETAANLALQCRLEVI